MAFCAKIRYNFKNKNYPSMSSTKNSKKSNKQENKQESKQNDEKEKEIKQDNKITRDDKIIAFLILILSLLLGMLIISYIKLNINRIIQNSHQSFNLNTCFSSATTSF